MKKPVIIGIAGGSASGKTSIAQELYDCFKGRHTIRIIKLDDYYKDQTHLSMDKRVLTNYDHPLAFDMDLLIEHLEGLFVLNEVRIRERCDILVYVDTDADIRFIRRLRRDLEERGRSLDSVCTQYLTTVRPMHEQFVEPSKKYAHIIIPEGSSNTVAIDLLLTKISSIVD